MHVLSSSIITSPRLRRGNVPRRRQRVNQSTPGFWDQVALRRLTMGVKMTLLLLSLSIALAAAPAELRNAFDEQLAKECSALTADAVKSPFGWGWAAAKQEEPLAPPKSGSDAKAKPAKRKPADARTSAKVGQALHRGEIDARQTAAAGLMLFLAGERLNDPALTKAAAEAARALAAVQQQSGQVPAIGVLSSGAGGHDEPTLVPSRTATCAAVGLFCAVLQGSEKPDARIVSALTKATTWLSAQQTQSGAFYVAFPPDGGKESTRVVRLDTPDYRDSTAALLLSARVLGDPTPTRRSNDAVTALLAMRVRSGDEKSGVLWIPAYRLTGETLQTKAEFPYSLDTVAAQYSMQTLLSACLLSEHWNDRAAADALLAASKSMESLSRPQNGGWYRHYHLLSRAGLDKESTTAINPLSEANEAAEMPVTELLAQTLAVAHAVAAEGPEAFLTKAYAEKGIFWPPHRVGIMLCGLGSNRLAMSQPRSKAEAEQFVKDHAAMWLDLGGLVPADLQTRIQRLNVLLLRAALEDVN